MKSERFSGDSARRRANSNPIINSAFDGVEYGVESIMLKSFETEDFLVASAKKFEASLPQS